jgi:hypothetical protein
VTLELGLPDLDYEGERERFLVWSLVATGVTRWESTGKLDTQVELTFTLAPDVDAPVALRVHAEATAVLAGASVTTHELEPRLRKARPLPWQHSFHMDSGPDAERTVGQLLDALGLADPRMVSLDPTPVTAERAWTLSSLRQRAHRTFELFDGTRAIAYIGPRFPRGSWALSVQRLPGATDDEWTRLWGLPLPLGAGEVSSRMLRTDADAWCAFDWRRGAKQPPKPAPLPPT